MRYEQTVQMVRKVRAEGEGWLALTEVDPVNRRVKLQSYRFDHSHGLAALGEHLLSLSREEGAGKVLAEVREADWEQFLGRGFILEGLIPGYFAGEDAYCVSYFVDPERQASRRLERENAIREAVLSQEPQWTGRLAPHFTVEAPAVADVAELAALYRKVFTSYPTPLHDPAYIHHLIATEKGLFRLVRDGRRIVSAAAAAVNWAGAHAEMTDCATLPDYRGEGMMAAILQELEQVLQARGVACRFSLARASSHGMNQVLRRLGYRLRGRMANNCHIMGNFEDMNLWVKYNPA
jgi:beta-lysine N6-acetyltransferase